MLCAIGFSLLLTGCIRPNAAPLPTVLPTLPTSQAGAPTALSTAAQLAPLPTTALSTVPVAALPTQPANPAATPIPQGLPLAADGVWRAQPVGPESVLVMFFHDPSGATCLRTIFRSVANARCASPGQALAIIAISVKTADKADYTVIAGRMLDGQVTNVIIEYPNNQTKSAPIDSGGFVLVTPGVLHPIDAAPVNATGNLIGGKVAF